MIDRCRFPTDKRLRCDLRSRKPRTDVAEAAAPPEAKTRVHVASAS